jgi:hypothetical protein
MHIPVRLASVGATGAFVASLLASSSVSAAASWNDPVRVFDTDASASTWASPVGLVTVGQSTIVVAYARHNSSSSLNDLFIRRSVDNGVTWSDPAQIGAANEAVIGASMSAYDNDVDIVDGANGIRYFHSDDGGATFGPAMTLDAYSGSAKVARGPNGIVAVTWTKQLRRNHKVFVRVSTDGGASFGTRTTLWEPGSFRDTAVAVGDGMIYVVSGETNTTIKIRRSVDGQSWTPSASLGQLYAGAGDRFNIAAENHEVYLVFDQASQGGMVAQYRHSVDSGASWTRRARLSTLGDLPSTPEIELSGGVARVAFGQGPVINNQAYSDTFYREIDSSGVSSLEQVSPPPRYSSFAFGVGFTDRAVVLYMYCVQGEYGCNIDVRTRAD